jgi:predicted ArsR family transcriptional regulator
MKKNKLNKRFFESTRGKIVMLLRGNERNVDELAKELGLTDNAVRSHLFMLERDGLVKQSGMIKGFRKPHFAYALTDEAEHLFPKPYDTLFNQLLDSLKKRVSGKALQNILHEVGQKIAGAKSSVMPRDASLNNRLEMALKALEELGGNAELKTDEQGAVISSSGCPLAAAVADHPEVCKLAESLIAEIVQQPVKENCNREKMPQCHFEIAFEK